MATTAQTKKANEASTAALADLGMEVEEKLELPLRGRQPDALIPAIRVQLEACLGDNTIRSFKNIPDNKTREKYARKVRSAGDMTTDAHGEVIPVLTRFDQANEKLFWGPESVMKTIGK